jgi:hypothetical protein
VNLSFTVRLVLLACTAEAAEAEAAAAESSEESEEGEEEDETPEPPAAAKKRGPGGAAFMQMSFQPNADLLPIMCIPTRLQI